MSKEPFVQDNIIGRFLKKAGVETLKKLRKMDQKLQYLVNIELEKRSMKGHLGPVDLSRGMFLHQTRWNPQLFGSFRLGFQDAFRFLESSFFALYRPAFLQLDLLPDFEEFRGDSCQYVEEFLGWISEDIQELKIHVSECIKLIHDQFPEVPSRELQTPLTFPKLTRFSFHNRIFPADFNQQFFCILDRSREVDPAPNLTHLEIELRESGDLGTLFGSDPCTPIAISRWSTLTHLSLDSNCNFQRVSSMLLSLASVGMSLESLGLLCQPQDLGLDLDAICSDLSQFFAIQAKSLKILKLEFSLGLEFEEYYEGLEEFLPRIIWPIFEFVHTLKLMSSFFEIGPIPLHFPSLINLHMGRCYSDFKSLFPDGPTFISNLEVGIAILGEDRTSKGIDSAIDWLGAKFKSVIQFKCNAELVGIGQRELPWIETLEELEITDVRGPIKVGYLKGLKNLVIDSYFGFGHDKMQISWLDQARSLKLSSITFKHGHPNYRPYKDLKDEYNWHFPFDVKFEEDPEFFYLNNDNSPPFIF